MARANSLKNSGVPDDIFQLDDLSVLVGTESPQLMQEPAQAPGSWSWSSVAPCALLGSTVGLRSIQGVNQGSVLPSSLQLLGVGQRVMPVCPRT